MASRPVRALVGVWLAGEASAAERGVVAAGASADVGGYGQAGVCGRRLCLAPRVAGPFSGSPLWGTRTTLIPGVRLFPQAVAPATRLETLPVRSTSGCDLAGLIQLLIADAAQAPGAAAPRDWYHRSAQTKAVLSREILARPARLRRLSPSGSRAVTDDRPTLSGRVGGRRRCCW